MKTNRDNLKWLARSFGRTDYLPLQQDDLDALLAAGEPVLKYPGTHLFREGEVAESAYVIEQGDVELYRGPRKARRVVGRVHAGDVVGDIAMFRGEPYVSSARAVGEVSAYRFDGRRLLPVLLEHPVVALRWLVAGLTQLESAQRRVLGLMQRTVKQQVAELLLDEVDSYGDVHLSQSGIATLLGVSRQSVNKAIGELSSDAIAESGYRVVKIVDREGLAAILGR